MFGWRGPVTWNRRAKVIATAIVLVWLAALAAFYFAATAQAAPTHMTKAQRALHRHNLQVLNQRMQEHPVKAKRAKVAAPVRRGTVARTAAGPSAGGCRASAGWIPQRNPGTAPIASDAIIMHWANTSGCYVACPPCVIEWISTNMVDPRGFQNPDTEAGYPVVDIAGVSPGPEGWWQMNNIVTWALPPTWIWPSAAGYCTGARTSVVTCYYNYGIPILMP